MIRFELCKSFYDTEWDEIIVLPDGRKRGVLFPRDRPFKRRTLKEKHLMRRSLIAWARKVTKDSAA